MKKALNVTQTIIESILGSAVLTLIVLAIMMALSSCGSAKYEAKAKHKWMHDKKDVSFKNLMNNKRFDTENGKAVIYAFALIGWMATIWVVASAIGYVVVKMDKISSLESRINSIEKRCLDE